MQILATALKRSTGLSYTLIQIVFCRTELLCCFFFFFFRETPKRTKVARASLKILAPFGITRNNLRKDVDCGASQQRPDTTTVNTTTERLHEPQISPPSGSGNTNERCGSLNMSDWRSFFFSPSFPCHSTSYNITWFAKNAFLNYRKLLLDLLAKAGWERNIPLPSHPLPTPKGTEEDKQLKLLKSRLEDQTLLISLYFSCLMYTWEKLKLHSYCLSVGGDKLSKCWCGCMCAVLSHCVTVAPGFTTCK